MEIKIKLECQIKLLNIFSTDISQISFHVYGMNLVYAKSQYISQWISVYVP